MGLRIPVYALIIKASLYSEWRNTGSVRLLGQSGLLEEVRLGAHGEGRRVRRRLLEHFPSLLILVPHLVRDLWHASLSVDLDVDDVEVSYRYAIVVSRRISAFN